MLRGPRALQIIQLQDALKFSRSCLIHRGFATSFEGRFQTRLRFFIFKGHQVLKGLEANYVLCTVLWRWHNFQSQWLSWDVLITFRLLQESERVRVCSIQECMRSFTVPLLPEAAFSVKLACRQYCWFLGVRSERRGLRRVPSLMVGAHLWPHQLTIVLKLLFIQIQNWCRDSQVLIVDWLFSPTYLVPQVAHVVNHDLEVVASDLKHVFVLTLGRLNLVALGAYKELSVWQVLSVFKCL